MKNKNCLGVIACILLVVLLGCNAEYKHSDEFILKSGTLDTIFHSETHGILDYPKLFVSSDSAVFIEENSLSDQQWFVVLTPTSDYITIAYQDSVLIDIIYGNAKIKHLPNNQPTIDVVPKILLWDNYKLEQPIFRFTDLEVGDASWSKGHMVEFNNESNLQSVRYNKYDYNRDSVLVFDAPDKAKWRIIPR
jgi:hypothetical protein